MKIWTPLHVPPGTKVIEVSPEESRRILSNKKNLDTGVPLSSLPLDVQEKLSRGERVPVLDIVSLSTGRVPKDDRGPG
jgi:hypothetical protein